MGVLSQRADSVIIIWQEWLFSLLFLIKLLQNFTSHPQNVKICSFDGFCSQERSTSTWGYSISFTELEVGTGHFDKEWDILVAGVIDPNYQGKLVRERTELVRWKASAVNKEENSQRCRSLTCRPWPKTRFYSQCSLDNNFRSCVFNTMDSSYCQGLLP